MPAIQELIDSKGRAISRHGLYVAMGINAMAVRWSFVGLLGAMEFRAPASARSWQNLGFPASRRPLWCRGP
jgi:hypothetical protein